MSCDDDYCTVSVIQMFSSQVLMYCTVLDSMTTLRVYRTCVLSRRIVRIRQCPVYAPARSQWWHALLAPWQHRMFDSFYRKTRNTYIGRQLRVCIEGKRDTTPPLSIRQDSDVVSPQVRGSCSSAPADAFMAALPATAGRQLAVEAQLLH